MKAQSFNPAFICLEGWWNINFPLFPQFFRRNPLSLMCQTAHDGSQHLTSLSQVDHTNDSSSSDLIDAAKLTTLQPER